MLPYTLTQWKRDGSLVYALNYKGTNRFSARFESPGGPNEASELECKYNAQLACSAPEMLAALLECEEVLAIQAKNLPSQLLRQVRAAIKSATYIEAKENK